MKRKFGTGLLVVLLAGLFLLTPVTSAFAGTTVDVTTANDLMAPVLIQATEEESDRNGAENIISNSVNAAVSNSSKWDPYSCWYCYNRMTEADQAVWDAMYANCIQIANDTTNSYSTTGKVSVPSGWTQDKLEQFCLEFRQCNPQFYFLRCVFQWWGNSGNITGVAICLYQNFQSGANRANASTQFLNKLTSWGSSIRTAGSEYEMARAAHDIIRNNVYYNNSVLSGDNTITDAEEEAQYTQSAYSGACLGTTVCAGYSLLFSALCNAVNVDTFSVTSSTHQWNKCRTNDVWSNVDVTWDDSGYGYSFFCRSNSAMLNLDSSAHVQRSLWDSQVPACTIDSGASTSSYGWISAPSAVLATPTVNVTRSDNTATVTLYAPNGGDIYYTLDGTTPSQANSRSDLYRGTFQVTHGTTVRAMAAANGWQDSAVSAATNVVIISYPITYHLDQGTNATANPATIYEGSSIALQNPTRDGAYFLGWYLDANLTQRVTTLTTSMARTDGAYHLYAKWELLTTSGWTYSVLSDGTARITACTLSGDVVMPETLNGRTVTQMEDELFASRNDITTITLSSGIRSMKELGYYFWNCTKLYAIYVNSNSSWFASVNGVLYTKDLSAMVFYPMAKTDLYLETPAETTVIQKYALINSWKRHTLRLTNPNISWNYERFRTKMAGEMLIVTAGGTAEQTVINEMNAGYSDNATGTDTYPYYAVVSSAAPTVKNTIKNGYRINLSWSAIEGVSTYEVLRRTDSERMYSVVSSTTGTSYLDTNTEEGKTYYYIAGAKDPGTGLLRITGNMASGKMVTVPKLAPTPKATVVSSTGRVKLSWKTVTNAATYCIWRNPGGNYAYKVGTTTGTTWTDTTAEPGSSNKYTIQVILKDGTESKRSDPVTITTRCAAPKVTVTPVASSGKPKLSWSAVTGATKYKIYRSTSKDGKYTLIKTTDSTTFTNTGAKVNTKYYYKVMAVCSVSAGNSAYSTVKYITVDLAKPVVTITTSSGKPKLTWKAITGAEKYKIYRATSKSGTYSLLKTVTAKSYKDTSAKKGKTYYYKVQAISDVSAAASAKSTVKSVKCTK